MLNLKYIIVSHGDNIKINYKNSSYEFPVKRNLKWLVTIFK